MKSLSEIELQKLYAGVDETEARGALEEMLGRNAAKLRGKALRLCGFDRTDADDLYQAASLLLWSKRNKYIPSAAPWIAWAIRVLCGCASDRRKKRNGKFASRVQSIGDSAEAIAGNEESPEQTAFGEEFGEAVADCIRSLNSELREVFLLHFDGEETFERVTETLKLGQGATPAKHRYDTAVKDLGSCLRRKGYRMEDL